MTTEYSFYLKEDWTLPNEVLFLPDGGVVDNKLVEDDSIVIQDLVSYHRLKNKRRTEILIQNSKTHLYRQRWGFIKEIF